MTAERSRDTRLELLQEHFSAECDAYQHAGASFIITPLLRQDNDRVTLRIDELRGGRVLITDGGETIDYLRLSGCAVRTSAPFRKRIHAIGATFGVKIEDEEISLEADECDVAEALATVARAAQHMSYLVYYRRTRTVPRFGDRVEAELIVVGARYKRDVKVWGCRSPGALSHSSPRALDHPGQPVRGLISVSVCLVNHLLPLPAPRAGRGAARAAGGSSRPRSRSGSWRWRAGRVRCCRGSGRRRGRATPRRRGSR